VAGPGEPLDLLVVGSGVAGLTAAVGAAEHLGLAVGVLTKGELHQGSTRWAQGGVAAVLGEDPDSTDLHLADTLAAGAGLCDVEAVRVLVDEGPGRVHALIALGAMFDTDEQGDLALAREGGHSLPRVVHAGGAATGVEVERALVDAVHATAAALHEHTFAHGLVVEDGECAGVRALDPAGDEVVVRAHHVLLATGGAGQVFAVTTNPLEVTGDGIAMALRAGVAVADLEFIQFHPTALHHPRMPRPLLSEALRGHGALLRDAAGDRFVDELAPRDVVSRAMTARMLEQGVEHLWLDATGLGRFGERFPTLAAALADIGLDPVRDLLPIAPAAHYTCGGVVTDLDGATSLPGLWAAGEVACSGVHGANRLASNSLLEGMVFASRVVDAIQAGRRGPRADGAMRSVLTGTPDTAATPRRAMDGSGTDGARTDRGAATGAGGPEVVAAPEVIEGRTVPGWVPPAPAVGTPATDPAALRDRLQRAMTSGAGVLRDAGSLAETAGMVEAVAVEAGRPATPEGHELANLVAVARAVVAAATARTESRGAHTRRDFPDTDPSCRHRLVLGGHGGAG
jgi:L-aspartate oxidase